MEPKVRSETTKSGVTRSRTTIVHASSLTRIAARCVVHGFRAQLLEPTITLTVCFLLYSSLIAALLGNIDAVFFLTVETMMY